MFIPKPLPDVPVGGRLSLFEKKWGEVCEDSHALEAVRHGVALSFLDRPPLLPEPVFSVRSDRRHAEILFHVEEMLQKDAVERAPLPSHGYYSNMFLVPKKNGEMRPIINLKSLNNAVEKGKFKMETQRAIRRALQQGDWVTSIDLKDAYFHIPIKPAFRKFLRFTVGREVFQFKALPFGLTSAPREFTRVTSTLASIVHRKGINLHLYLDDWLLRARSFEKCLQQTREVVQDTTDLGFIVNPVKSDLVPTQKFSFLGEDFNLVEGLVRPTQEKVAKIQALCRILKKHPCQEARFLLKVLGVMNAVADVIPLGRLHMRPLQLYLLSQWSMSTQPLSCKVFLNSFFQEHLSWWNSPENLLEGQLLHLPKETEELCTDSSMTGWGATLNTVHMVHGVWDQTTSDSRSINWLELKTVHLAILHFLDLLKHRSVMIRSDNLATIYNLDKQGGTHSPELCYLAWEILRLCHQHKILVRVQHLTGELNVLADQLSRSHKAIPTEWSLCPRAFRVRRPRHRPVRHSPEPSDPGLHQPVPGPECPSPGRSQRRLELSSSGLWLSTDADLAEGPPEDPAIIGQHHPGGSGMADPVLVSGPTQSLHGSPTRDPGRSGPPLADGATQDLDAPQPGNVQLPRLDVVRNSLTARGFSQATADRIAVPQRSSTRSIYDGKWAEFCSWCSRKKTDPVKATIPIVADFLVHLFERRPPLAVSTIRGYRSAISSTIPSGSAITNSKEIGDLFRSLANDRPVTKVFYPKWSLRIVLNYLTKDPFEHISKCSLENLTLKTVFLVALRSE